MRLLVVGLLGIRNAPASFSLTHSIYLSLSCWDAYLVSSTYDSIITFAPPEPRFRLASASRIRDVTRGTTTSIPTMMKRTLKMATSSVRTLFDFSYVFIFVLKDGHTHAHTW